MKPFLRFGVVALLVLLMAKLSAGVDPAGVEPAAAKAECQFLRLKRDESDRPISLDAAIVRCAPGKDGGAPTVDLVAAVHVADADYYRRLNREFKRYDAVLYELVAPERAGRPKPGATAGNNPVTMLQKGLKDLLELEFQLQGIDYTRENMVHADMSPEQIARSMRKRGESAATIFARLFSYALSKQGQSSDGPSDVDLLAALFDKNRALALKRVLAEQFADNEDLLAALEGPDGSTLISGRNQAALKVLRKEIDSGKKKLAIFYGAGHMPDLLKRLRDDFSLVPVGARWLVAWDLKPGKKKQSVVPNSDR